MDSDQGKLFIGGISWETNEEKLKEYFQGFGEVVQAVVMRDKITGKPRGFGFVVFSDPDNLDRVLEERHVIDGRTVEAKRALSREEQQGPRIGNLDGSRNFGGGGGGGGNNTRTKKIFVGGLPPTLSEDGFRSYFETFGAVTDVVIMYDQQTNRPRGFGFISFDSEDAVDRVLHKTFHDLSGKQVEVKRALPKDSNPGGGGGRSMGGGGYQGFGSALGNPNTYNGFLESNRYMQSQNSGSGYPFASPGYTAPGYGFGPTNNAMGYGYGNYGSANAAFGGPAGGGYGNPNAPNAHRGLWNSQAAAAGYGYGGSQWGSVGGGSTGVLSGGSGMGQSPSGASGYGSQGYGYGGNEGGYGSQAAAHAAAAHAAAAYGAVGGRAGSGPNGGAADQAGSDYFGGAYGDANAGYGNSGWRSDASQAPGNFGGGYGGSSARQAQQ